MKNCVRSVLLFFALAGASAAFAQVKGYVSVQDGQTLSVIDTATQSVVAAIPMGEDSRPQRGAVSPDGARVYLADFSLGFVSVIDAASNTVTTTIPVSGGSSVHAHDPGN